MTSKTLLDVKGLTVSFSKESSVVQSLDFSLLEGKTLGILGESGSGKSMTLYSLMGLSSYFGATVEFDSFRYCGRNITDLVQSAEKWRGKEVAMIFQDPGSALHPFMLVSNQIREALRLRENRDLGAKKKFRLSDLEEDQLILELLEKVKMRDPRRVFNSRVAELSGGMRQRVMIAMALASKPKILLADEPSSAIDLSNQQSLIELLTDLQNEMQLSLLLVTHDLHFLSAIADEILVMKKGRVIERGPARQVLVSPQEQYTQELVRLSQWN